MSFVTAKPNADGTRGAWTGDAGETTNLYAKVIDASDSTYIKTSTGSDSVFLLLDNMPADFDKITAITVSVRGKRNSNKGDYINFSSARIYKSDESTALTAASTFSFSTTVADYSEALALTGSLDKTSWDGARIKLTSDGGSSSSINVYEVSVAITYQVPVFLIMF